MIEVVIHPTSWRWYTPAEVHRFRTQLGAAFDDGVFELAPPPKPAPDNPEIATNADDIAQYNAGFRRFRYGVDITIPLEVLSYYLPCEVVGIHGHLSITEVARRAEPAFNDRVQVMVPGLPLLAIDDVTHEVNCCTDYLQSKLNDSWRILAVCVQPDQRRPDYILGRQRQPDERHYSPRPDVLKPMPPRNAATPAPAPKAAEDDDPLF